MSTIPKILEVHNEILSPNASESPSLGPSIIDHLSSATPAPSFFHNARNFEVKDAQFNVNANVTINNNATTNDPVSTILWPHVVAGAIFNSAVRHAAGKCHPGTRKKIIERIVAWIEDPDPTQRILWLYGPAGAGKSAIAQTMCELIQESHPDNEGASFFFASGTPDRGNALKLFATLAYQLAIQFPSIRAEINTVLSRDPSLPTKSMEIQLFYLIIQPLKQCQSLGSCSPVLIIDGLDECGDEEGLDTQRNIVALIARSVVDHKIPLRFMVASRPEYWIRDAFDRVLVSSITLPLSLQDDVDAEQDIRTYLIDGFEQIRIENKRIMGSVGSPWPPKTIVDHFVYEASGQYIYAATVLRFVGKFSKFSNPQKQLAILISPGPNRALAFSEIDRLYATILSAYPEWETMKRVLAAILLDANDSIITIFLKVDSDELVLVLDALSSLIDIKKHRLFSEDQMLLKSVFDSESLRVDSNKMSFCHRSFSEFLRDETRSGSFYIDLKSDAVPREIIHGFLGMVEQNLDQNYEIEPHIFCNIDYPTYHDEMPDVTGKSVQHCTPSILIPLITHLTVKLERFDPRKLIHVHSVFYFLRDMLSARYDLFNDRLAKKQENSELSEFQTACHNLQQAIELILEEALSALVLCSDFEVTPALVYLTEYWGLARATEYWFGTDYLPHEGLRVIAGVNDVISALNQHRYVFSMGYATHNESWVPIRVCALLFWNGVNPSWRTQGAWRDLRIAFAHKSLKWIFNDPRIRPDMDDRYSALISFFHLKALSDIANEEYFHNPCNLALLSEITNLEGWISLLDDNRIHVPLLLSFLVSILCWINRQLKNPQTVKLLQNYNTTLRQKMVTTIDYIFERGFLEGFSGILRKEICALGVWGRPINRRSIAIKVWPLPKGFYEETLSPSGYNDWNHSWQAFHDELFGNPAESGKRPVDPIILPSRWHPYLLTALLKLLIRFLYGRIHPDFSTEVLVFDMYEQSFPYISECLPYAHPTPENLDALRAIVYLYPQVSPTWNPPENLWPLLVDFLHKYDPSILSPEELRLFVAWLNSTKHDDIKTYVDG